MDRKAIRLLLIDDKKENYEYLKSLLKQVKGVKYQLDWEQNRKDAVNTLCREEYDVYLVNESGELSGVDIMSDAQGLGCLKPVIILSDNFDEAIEYRSMNGGSSDYIVVEDLSTDLLTRAVRYAIGRHAIISEMVRSKQKYQSLFERSLDPIFIAGENGEIHDVNPAFLNLFKLNRGKALNLEIEELFQNKEDYQSFFNELKSKDTAKVNRVILKSGDNDKLICKISCTMLNGFKDQVEFQGVIHDYTEVDAVEKQLVRSDKLAMTGRIARSIAHEVRNPVTNINLAVEQLNEELGEDEDLIMYTNIIERNSSRINSLIHELVKSAKPTKLELKKHPINEVIEEVLEMASDRLKLNEISVEKDLSSAEPKVMLDRNKVKLALLNMVINAIEAMEPGKGKLTIKSSCMPDKEVDVIIQDNGKGIPEKELNKLFDAFYTGKKSGMGLGLTTTQNIIESHRAKIDVHSEPGVGTAFIVSFPGSNM